MPILITQVEQYQYGDNGVLLNGPASLPFIDVNSVQGLDSGEFRDTDFARDGAHGSYIDAFFQAAKTVTIEGVIYADPNNMEAFLDQVKANFAPGAADQPFYFKTDNATDPDRLVYGKSLGIQYNKDNMRRVGSANFQLQIRCGDPRIYSQTLTTESVSWGTGSASLVLGGNRPSPGTVTLIGPLTNPGFTHSQTGTNFTFSSFSLPSGQNIVIDLNRHTVLQGSINRRNILTLSGNWPEFVAGTNNFSLSGSGTGQFSASGRSAWW